MKIPKKVAYPLAIVAVAAAWNLGTYCEQKEYRINAELRRQGDSTAKQRREMLEAHRKTIVQQMQMLNDCLAVIDYKIERHRRNEQNV